jgi:hypothetical protein
VSIELDILPSLAGGVFWGDVQRAVSDEITSASLRDYFGTSLVLRELSTKRALGDERLTCPGNYFFDLTDRPCTLSLVVEPFADVFERADYMNSFGRNLDLARTEAIRESWTIAEYIVSVSSLGGRPAREIDALLFVAKCVAKVVQGFIVVKDNRLFGLDVGIYPPSVRLYSET